MGGSGRIWLVNGICVVLIAMGVSRLRQDWASFESAHQPRLLANQPERAAANPAVTPAPSAANESWTDILARHVFSFDRNDINLVPPAVVEAPKVAQPKPLLFGVVDLGSGRRAMLGDAGARRSTNAVKVGEKFKNWTVVRIEPRSVVVQSDGVEETLELGNAPVDRDAGKTVATSTGPAPIAVTSTSPAPAAAPSPTAVQPAIGLPPGTPVVAPPGTQVKQTPFGPVIEQLP